MRAKWTWKEIVRRILFMVIVISMVLLALGFHYLYVAS